MVLQALVRFSLRGWESLSWCLCAAFPLFLQMRLQKPGDVPTLRHDEKFSIYCNWQSMRDMQNIARRGCNLEALGLLLRAIAVLRKRIKDSILKIRSYERH